MLEFLNKYFFFIWLVMVVGMFTFLLFKGISLMSPFKKLRNEKVLFFQRFVSAKSLNPMKKNRGGAGKSLHILITENYLLLKPTLLLAYFFEQGDLLHIIPIENILETRIEKRTLFSKLYVKYQKADGNINEIVIMSSKNDIIDGLITRNAYNRTHAPAQDLSSKQ